MNRGLGNRLGRLEARQTGGVGDRDEERFAYHRALQERKRKLAKEDPELGRRHLDAEDEVLEATEEARARGEDPEDAPEVLAAQRALERLERRLLNENDDDEGGDSATA